MTDIASRGPVLVVGASGPLGRALVSLLLARGLRVRAFARHATSLGTQEGLERIDASVLDHRHIDEAVAGTSAVVCVLGPTRGSEPDLCSRGTERIVRAMREHHVRRLVCVTGAMIGHPAEHLGRVYSFIARHVPEDAMHDRRMQETVVRESGLEWTLVRPTRLTDTGSTHALQVGEDFDVGALAHVSRTDVARFIADVLDDAGSIGRAHTLAYDTRSAS